MRKITMAKVLKNTILMIIAFSCLFPFIWFILGSFKSSLEIYTPTQLLPKAFRFANYISAWTEGNIGKYLKNSLIIASTTLITTLIFATMSGYSFAKLWIKKFPFIFYIFLLGMAIPVQVAMLTVFSIIKNIGLHNKLMGVVIVLSNSIIGTYMMRNFFMDIPDSFSESAKIEGANEFYIFTKIYLPIARPGIIALGIFTLLGVWNEFTLSLILLTNHEKWTVPIGVLTFLGDYDGEYGKFFAAAVITLMPIIGIYIAFQRNFLHGISAGGIKG